MGVRQATVQFRTACVCGVPGAAGKTYGELHRRSGSWWETAGARGTRLACLPTSPHPSVVAMVVVTVWVMVMVVLATTKSIYQGLTRGRPPIGKYQVICISPFIYLSEQISGVSLIIPIFRKN